MIYIETSPTISIDVADARVSDGYHSFEELYEHRYRLFLALAYTLRHHRHCWRSKYHEDGSGFDGYFIAGIELETGQITYHLPDELWDECGEFLDIRDKAPEWDGHTSADVIERLKKFVEP